MEAAELIEVISRGEDSHHQFKSNVHNQESLAEEIVAMANSGGGMVLIGVTDKTGLVVGLTLADIARLNNLISNAAAESVTPPLAIRTENISHPDGLVLVVHIPDGLNKPYMDKKGVISIKVGADKRRSASREELQRLFQQASLVHADETPVPGFGVADVDLTYFGAFFRDQFGESLAEHNVPLPQLLANMNLINGGSLNVAGALLFAKAPQFRLPMFIVKAVAFPGMDIEDQHYLDSRDLTGKISEMFEQGIRFLEGNTRAFQNGQSVNSLGEPEVPRIVWEELLANALIHRDYFITAPVRVLVFADRVEIISPGHLPNNLTVANIKAGNSNIRNPILASFASKLLPYRGLGSGLLRSLRLYPDIELIDDRSGNLFKVIVSRRNQPFLPR
jgi:ATP-dependent DNA helicase RecG